MIDPSVAPPRFAILTQDVLRVRERVVLDHFHDEVVQDWDATLSTFPHPHYEVISTLTVHVRAY